jgi:hypothetical protein
MKAILMWYLEAWMLTFGAAAGLSALAGYLSVWVEEHTSE